MTKINLPNLAVSKRNGYLSYYYRYVLQGKRFRISLGNTRVNTNGQIRARYRDAQTLVYNLQHGIAPVQQVDQGQKPVYLSEVFDDWVAHERNRCKSWIRDLHNIKHFVIYFGQESDWIVDQKRVSSSCKIDLAALTSKDINNFYNDQYEKHSNQTVSHRNRYLNPLYTWLENEKILEDNYYSRKAKLRDPKDGKVPYQVLTRDQAVSIVENAPDEFHKTFWSIMLDTALSPVDALALNRKDDLQLGGQDNLPCIVTSRKKSGKISAIAMSSELIALGDLVWSLEGDKTVQDDSNEAFKKVCRKLGIKQNKGEKLSQYCFRHSLATHLVNIGWSLDQVQRALGHTLGSKVTEGYLANQIANEVVKQQQATDKRTA